MKNTLTNFLKLKPAEKRTEDVTVTVQGQKLEFTVKPIAADRLYDIQIANMVAIPSSVTGGPTGEGANPIRLARDILVEAIVEPNLRDAALQDHFGVTSGSDLVEAIFEGSYSAMTELMNKVIEISVRGGDSPGGTSAELVEEAKN